MRRTVAALAAVILLSACTASTTPAPSTAAATSAGQSSSSPAAASPGATTAAGGSYDPSTITGNVVLSGWQSSPAEGNALTQTLLVLPGRLSEHQGRLPADRRRLPARSWRPSSPRTTCRTSSTSTPTTRTSGSTRASSRRSTTTSPSPASTPASSSRATSSIFKGTDGKTYGLPKDGNTIAHGLQHATSSRPPPKTMDELVTRRHGAQGQERPQGADVPEPGPRPRPGVPVRAGRLAPDRRRQDRAAIDSDASKTAVQWYMDLFKNGLGMTAGDLGDGWCGEALGKKQVAIIFEGGWLDPAMTSTYPDVKYAWARDADGLVRQPGDDLLHRQLLDRRRRREQGPGLASC